MVKTMVSCRFSLNPMTGILRKYDNVHVVIDRVSGIIFYNYSGISL